MRAAAAFLICATLIPAQQDTATDAIGKIRHEALDLKQASVVAASLVWHLAAREAALPRFEKDKMPAPAAPPPPVTQ